jgi:hypothetical protein
MRVSCWLPQIIMFLFISIGACSIKSSAREEIVAIIGGLFVFGILLWGHFFDCIFQMMKG